uniref:Coagulation factor XIII, A1 polypeptide b n=1 Tax=Nothobranchius furzeri TaxID=105023 RepID=A0A8C6VYB0_NOTFU
MSNSQKTTQQPQINALVGLHTGNVSDDNFLDIWDVDMMKRPDESNKIEHHTTLYHSDYLIVRRGQEFEIKITFNRPYKPNEDKFAVEFVIGSSPAISKGTYVPVFPKKEKQSSWRGRIKETSDNIVTMGLTPIADCIVGKYNMYVAVQTPFGTRRTRKDDSRAVYILFNPWAADDAVFLDDEKERQECVMNEVGIIYHGAYDDISERDWNYGQFNFGVLDACLLVMDRSEMPITNRGDPIKVTRKASAMINSRDDDGVLVGNWSGDYTYGVAPTSWTGSTDILLTYASTKMPVCYAQCWVYAAVFNTFLRCLGIPSRVVTNYFSAHDNDGNLRTDIILDENGRVDRNRTRDSIWNYHCWNECYMSRPDLPQGFGGWQVVDATPQETSDGMYRCGPASVQAIKHGDICYPFDAAFVFAEVNSDVVYYSRKKDGTMQLIKVNRTHVGRMVLTKAAGEVTRRDITDNYKFSEGQYLNSFNSKFIVVCKLLCLIEKLSNVFKVRVSGTLVITSVTGNAIVNEEMIARVEFTNPFTHTLKDVEVRMDGPGVMEHKKRLYSLIPGGTSLTWTEMFTPQRAGKTRVFATLDCPGLRQVSGQASINVKP